MRQNDFDDAPHRRMTSGTKLVLGITIAALWLILALSIGAIVILGPSLPKQVNSQKSRSSNSQNDPWPECAAVRKWLQVHAHDPASVEIVKWEDRRLISGPPNEYDIIAQVRGRTRLGAISSFLDTFHVDRNGAVSTSYHNKNCCHD